MNPLTFLDIVEYVDFGEKSRTVFQIEKFLAGVAAVEVEWDVNDALKDEISMQNIGDCRSWCLQKPEYTETLLTMGFACLEIATKVYAVSVITR